MKVCYHASLISQVASKGAMYKVKMVLRACKSGAVSHTQGSTNVSVGPLCLGPDVHTQTQASKLVWRFVACPEDCLHYCDRAHKRASITTLCHIQHLQQHWSTASFKRHRCIPPALPKQIQNELYFLILINHPSSQPPGWFFDFFFLTVKLLSPPKIDCCLQLAMCLFMRDSNHRMSCTVSPKRVRVFFSVFFFFLLFFEFTVESAEETAFITYSSRTIGPKPCVAGCRSKGKAWGVNLSVCEGFQCSEIILKRAFLSTPFYQVVDHCSTFLLHIR